MVPKARYAMTKGHCHFELGLQGAISPPADPGQGRGPGENSPEAHDTLLFYGTKIAKKPL